MVDQTPTDPILTELKEINATLKDSIRSDEKKDMFMFVLVVTQTLLAFSQLLIAFAYSDNWSMKGLGILMTGASIVILVVFGKKVFKKQ